MKISKGLDFSIVFCLISPLIYFLSDIYKFPLLTYFPATDEIFWGWRAFSEESGPAMYWYGWILSSVLMSGALAFCTSCLLKFTTKVGVLLSHLSWIAVILIIPFLIQSLNYYWK